MVSWPDMHTQASHVCVQTVVTGPAGSRCLNMDVASCPIPCRGSWLWLIRRSLSRTGRILTARPTDQQITYTAKPRSKRHTVSSADRCVFLGVLSRERGPALPSKVECRFGHIKLGANHGAIACVESEAEFFKRQWEIFPLGKEHTIP